MNLKNKSNYKNKFISQKGFIGAIGDDLPSLIPIIVALLLFFTIFSLTLTSYNSKNFVLRKNMSLISISRDIKGDSLLLNVDQFLDRCETKKLENQKYNYRIGVYSNEKLNSLIGENFQIINDFKETLNGKENFLKGETSEGNEESFFCEYIRLAGKELTDKRANYLMRFYPIAIQQKKIIFGSEYYLVLPAIMVMVIWE